MTVKGSVVLVAVLLSACLGVGDSLVVVRGSVHDPDGRPYDHCVVSLLLEGAKEPLDSVHLGGDSFDQGVIDVSFHVPGRWRDSNVAVACDGAQDQFLSDRIGKKRPIPVNLGRIILEREDQ